MSCNPPHFCTGINSVNTLMGQIIHTILSVGNEIVLSRSNEQYYLRPPQLTNIVWTAECSVQFDQRRLMRIRAIHHLLTDRLLFKMINAAKYINTIISLSAALHSVLPTLILPAYYPTITSVLLWYDLVAQELKTLKLAAMFSLLTYWPSSRVPGSHDSVSTC